jgi:hypothetical protein
MMKTIIIGVLAAALAISIAMQVLSDQAASRELHEKIAQASKQFNEEQEEFRRDSDLGYLLADYARLLPKQSRTQDDYKRLGRIEFRLRSVWTETELGDLRHRMGF